RIRLLSSTILSALVMGVLTARFLEIDGNPYWSWFALGPSSTALLTALALSVHYHASAQRLSLHVLEITKQKEPNNHALHASSGGCFTLHQTSCPGTA
ncbi:MAG: hypothetical protein KDB03_28845, partial [Planctomycetales bacterium]|nr:hypothetical protein [Planctomycetales bacterium]